MSSMSVFEFEKLRNGQPYNNGGQLILMCTSLAPTIRVGDEVVVSIIVKKANGVKSVGVRPGYDAKSFTMVGYNMMVGDVIKDFSNGIGTAILSVAKDYTDVTVLEFVLKANSTGTKKISCEVSLLDDSGKPSK